MIHAYPCFQFKNNHSFAVPTHLPYGTPPRVNRISTTPGRMPQPTAQEPQDLLGSFSHSILIAHNVV